MEQKYYIACHKDEQVFKRSSSGGAFTAITDEWISKHGNKAVVYGCILDSSLKAVHIRATNTIERDRMCGSKYIGSNMSGILPKVAQDLLDENWVCFTGTPCQIAGLYSYLNARGIDDKHRLLTIDFVCHGVGSVRFFQDYIHHLERKYGSKATRCSFRAKKRPGKREDMEIVFKNGRRYYAFATRYDWFYSVYMQNLILRPSCYHCPFASFKRISDITISDNWAVDVQNTGLFSTIIANTEKGKIWTEYASASMKIQERSKQDVDQMNLHTATQKSEKHDSFWDVYLNSGYLPAQKMVGNNTLTGKLKRSISVVIYMLKLEKIAKALLYR